MRSGLLGAAGVVVAAAGACGHATVSHAASGHSTVSRAVTAHMSVRPVAKNAVNGGAMVWDKQASPDMFAAVAESAPLAARQSPDVLVTLSPQAIADIRKMMLADPQGAAKIVEQKFGPLDKAVKGLDCAAPDPFARQDDPKLPLVTCSTDGTEKLVLEPSILDGHQVTHACAEFDQQRGAWAVDLTFDQEAQRFWSKYTADHIGTQVAITLDSRAISHPVIQGEITRSTQVTGRFDKQGASEIAESLGGCHA